MACLHFLMRFVVKNAAFISICITQREFRTNFCSTFNLSLFVEVSIKNQVHMYPICTYVYLHQPLSRKVPYVDQVLWEAVLLTAVVLESRRRLADEERITFYYKISYLLARILFPILFWKYLHQIFKNCSKITLWPQLPDRDHAIIFLHFTEETSKTRCYRNYSFLLPSVILNRKCFISSKNFFEQFQLLIRNIIT